MALDFNEIRNKNNISNKTINSTPNIDFNSIREKNGIKPISTTNPVASTLKNASVIQTANLTLPQENKTEAFKISLPVSAAAIKLQTGNNGNKFYTGINPTEQQVKQQLQEKAYEQIKNSNAVKDLKTYVQAEKQFQNTLPETEEDKYLEYKSMAQQTEDLVEKARYNVLAEKSKQHGDLYYGTTQTLKTIGTGIVDSFVNAGQFVKNAFKSEMQKEIRDAWESIATFSSPDYKSKFKALRDVSDEQANKVAQNAINSAKQVLRKYNITVPDNVNAEYALQMIADIDEWVYKENKLEEATRTAHEKVQQENQALGPIGKTITQTADVVSQMVPTIVTNTVLPGAGSASMFLSSAQSSSEQALKEGATYEQAIQRGILSGATEVATEMIGGENLSKLTGVPTLFKKFGIDTPNKLAQVLLDVGSEGLEEMVSTGVQPLIDRATYNSNAEFATASDYWASFKDSILPTLFFVGVNQGVTAVNNYKAKAIEKVEQSNMTVEQKEQAKAEIEKGAQEIIKIVQNNTNLEENSPNAVQLDENNVQNVSKLEKTVQNDTERFSQQVEQWKNNKWNPKEDLVVLEKTPQLYLDMGLKDFPITITTSKLESVYNESGKQRANYHNLNELVKQLPEAIQRPLNIVESVTRDDSIVIITDLTDYKGDIVVVSLALDNEGKISINNVLKNKDTNRMTSAYGRINYDYNINENGEYEDGWMELNKKNNRIIYDIDEGIIKKRVDGKWLQLPSNINSSNVSSTTNIPINNIIPTSQDYVNNQQENIMPSTEQLKAQDLKQGEEAYNTLNMKKANNKNPNFMLVNEKDSYKRNMFNNNAKAINDLIKAKNNTIKEINSKIKTKKNELNNKKDKTTKLAQNIQRQIINLEKRKADVEQEYIKKIDRLENRNAGINKLKKQVSENRIPTRREIQEKIITEKDLGSYNFDDAKEISKFNMNNTTPERVMEKTFNRETAFKLNEEFIKPIKHNEAERIRFMNIERQEINDLGIKPKSLESSAVQKYGEGVVVNESTGQETEYTLKDLQLEFPNDWEKIKNAAEVIRNKYDTYLDAINQVLNENGYDSIPKLKNYFRHFEAINSLFDQIGIPTKENLLPTDLNGLTADLKPGKNFFANALSRTGKKTTYDAITGIDGYLEGASKMIYHTEDIQKLRTLDKYIREKYSQQTDLSNLKDEEFNTRVEQIQNNHLSEFASWLTEYTNNLAGKKSKMDRGTEEALGRKVYGTLNFLKKQVGSNLTGFNLNTALSNFISVTQAGAKTSKVAMVQGLGDTFKNIFENDGFINKSDFLTRRFGSDKLSKTWWEKASNAGQIFMSGTDYFTANLITRSKYYEYLNKGYSEAEAIKKADEFADRIMGGRALGDMPNIFNSKTLGILTQFQLENVNQFDSMFHDTKYENRAEEQTKYEAKTWNEKIKSNLAESNPKFYNGLTATFILGQLFTYAWLFNKADEELTGSAGAFDIFGFIEKTIKDFTNPDITKEQATKNLVKNIIDQIPYANIITGGGRVPMSDALPNLYNILGGDTSEASEWWKLLNLIPPTGGGQLRKTYQGAQALIKGGDYTKDGRLKFPIAQEGNTAQKIVEGAQALLFGKWSTPNGQKYIDEGFKSLSKIQTEGLEKAKDLDISVKEFYDIMEKIKDIDVPTRKNKEGKDEAIPGARKKLIIDELNKTDLNNEQKKLMYDIFYSKELN